MLHASKEDWLKFVNENVISKNVDPQIAKAWERCKTYGVDPFGGLGKPVDVDAFQRALDENRELLNIARPMMANLHEIVLGSHYALVLADKYGRIIESIGDQVVNERVAKMRYCVGALWSEKDVGANAIGTTIFANQPLQFIGEDHYCQSHQNWCCSATTIHDEKGQVIGCLNMSGNREMANSHTLGIVVAAAYTIERELALHRSNELLESVFESTTDGMIIVDKELGIVKANGHAANILSLPMAQLMESDIRKIFIDLDFNLNLSEASKDQNHMQTDCLAVVDGRRINCAVNLVPLMSENGPYGFNISFRKALELHKTVNKVAGNHSNYKFEDIIGESQAIKQAIASAKKIARTRSSVLIEGESGTGKELFAQSIHNYSSRKKGPFVAINCASLPRELIESELFGYEKGSFTGALKGGKIGKFELAEGGTIFLDEIGELPLEVQAKLLRVLDNFTIRRIGSNYEKKLDVRIIAATNRNLMVEAENKNFRHDLYYRLTVFKLELPPLRGRDNDIQICANYFLSRLNSLNANGIKSFDFHVLEALNQYRWVGNLRELQNIIERAYYLSEGNIITIEELPQTMLNQKEEVTFSKVNVVQDSSVLDMGSIEKNNIINTLIKCDKNVLKAAKALNMSKSSIYRKISKYNIDVKGL